MPTSLQGIAKKAAHDKSYRFRNLFGMLTIAYVLSGWPLLNKRAASGVDRISARAYGERLHDHVTSLVERVKTQCYRAKLVRRHYIPKGNGALRPLGIPMGHAYCISLQRRLGIAVVAPTSMNAIDRLTQYNELGVADQVSSGKNRSESVRIPSNRSGLLTTTPTACLSVHDGLVGQTLLAVQSCHARRRYSWPFTS